MTAEELTARGFGLDHGIVSLVEVPKDWPVLGAAFAWRLRAMLAGRVVAVEHVGSTAVPRLLAKPILDVVAGVTAEPALDQVAEPLENAGWIYCGDGGDQGGLLFVLEARAWHRVAHLHVVCHDGLQWRNYLVFRDRLLTDSAARNGYESAKRSLCTAFSSDRKAYTDAKQRAVERILDGVTVDPGA